MINNISPDSTIHPTKDQPSSRERGRRKATHDDSSTDTKIIHRITERQTTTFHEWGTRKQSIYDGYRHRYEPTDTVESTGIRYADGRYPERWAALLDFLGTDTTLRVVRGRI